jgi:hypothetical protein
MTANYVVRDREESAVVTLRTFDLRLLTDASDPFVGTDWRVTNLAGLPAFETAWIDILATSEQRSEECDFFLWCGMAMNARIRFHSVTVVAQFRARF